jgi:hypothetical protein
MMEYLGITADGEGSTAQPDDGDSAAQPDEGDSVAQPDEGEAEQDTTSEPQA